MLEVLNYLVISVLAVIDFCLVKQLMCDWETNFCSLRTVWTSHASLTQRQGRAGRVSNGRCYRLITREFLRKIPTYSIPEMQVSQKEVWCVFRLQQCHSVIMNDKTHVWIDEGSGLTQRERGREGGREEGKGKRERMSE